MLSSEQLARLSALPPDSTTPGNIADLRRLRVDTGLPKETRILQFIEETGNPYCFTMDGHTIRTCFTPLGPTLQSTLEKLAQTETPARRE